MHVAPSRFAWGEYMPLVEVRTLQEPGLEVYSGMTDKELRDSPLAPHGLLIAESVKVIERALDAGAAARSLFVEDRWLAQSQELIARLERANPTMSVFRVTHAQMHKLTGYEMTRGPLAAFERPELPSIESLLERSSRVAVLEDITNYTNIGAIFRSAAALGVDAVLVTPSCHDPFYRRAARVSMGTVFQVPWTRIGTSRQWAEEGAALLHRYGFTVAAFALSDDSVALGEGMLAGCERLAIVLGTEGDGLAASTISACDVTVKIPMEHGVDSLNVAAASAVAFWELRRR